MRFKLASQYAAEPGCWLDFTHVKIDEEGLRLLHEVAKESNLNKKIAAMHNGEIINSTEKRQVQHFLLRTKDNDSDIKKEVLHVREKIREFSDKVRSGALRGFTGKEIKTIVAIGIGGSYLGPEFVYEALRFDAECNLASKGFTLKFLANVDPTDFRRAIQGIDFEQSLFVIVSKTFTTAETILNASTCR